MAEQTQTTVKKAQRSKKRVRLQNELVEVQKKNTEALSEYSRQIAYDDLFSNLYTQGNQIVQILEPPYLPGKMYELREQSGALNSCILAYVTNIDGYGFDIIPEEGSETDLKPEQQKVCDDLTDFFNQPNPEDSMLSIRTKLRDDLETSGNGFLEVVRDNKNIPSLLFWMDSRRTRLTKLDDEYTIIERKIRRGGKDIPIRIQKRFRRFAQIVDNHQTVRYFKEYGNTRSMNALTGEYYDKEDKPSDDPNKFQEATEIIHFKLGTGTYGVPRWISQVLSVMGGARAEFVNYDLFDSQGIPPMIISVSGGQLTEESLEDLIRLLKHAKGSENFNKTLVLEAEATGASLDGKESVPRLDIKNLLEYRKDDAMFLNYLSDSRDSIRKFGFRLPGVFVGQTDDQSYATASVTRRLAEEQIFIPERVLFDQIINATLIYDLAGSKFKFVSKGPYLSSNDELMQLLPILMDSGCMSLNEFIEFINKYFGTTMRLYEGEDAEWASLPIPKAIAKMMEEGEQEGEDGESDKELEAEDIPDEVDELVDDPEKVEKILKWDSGTFTPNQKKAILRLQKSIRRYAQKRQEAHDRKENFAH